MNTIISSRSKFHVYPGEYHPAFNLDALLERAQDALNENEDTKINIDEFDNDFKIEVALPGVEVQDIFIQVFNNVLAIVVKHNEDMPGHKKVVCHEFDHQLFEKYVYLPDGADAAFVSATYKQGILCIHIPKSAKPPSNIMQQIIPY
jgi:HSP20 family molecular chaperone IbpA